MPTNDIEKRRGYNRKWYAANKARVLEQHRGYRAANKEHIREQAAKWRGSNKEKRRGYFRKLNNFPLPTRDCPSTCESCGGPPSGRGSLHLDHCHDTGKFRGWLCHRCNTALGLLGDTILAVQNAMNYLKRVP